MHTHACTHACTRSHKHTHAHKHACMHTNACCIALLDWPQLIDATGNIFGDVGPEEVMDAFDRAGFFAYSSAATRKVSDKEHAVCPLPGSTSSFHFHFSCKLVPAYPIIQE